MAADLQGSKNNSFQCHPITLRFLDPYEEKKFTADYFESHIYQIRLALVVSFFIVASFGIYDQLYSPRSGTMHLIRFGILCPAILATFLFSYTRTFIKCWNLTICGLCVLISVGVFYMSVITIDYFFLYWVGLILLVFAMHTFLRLRFVFATITTLIIIVSQELLSIWVKPLSMQILVCNTLYLLAAAEIGVFASYHLEKGSRVSYGQQNLLESEREITERLLLNILPRAIVNRLKENEEKLRIEYSQVIVDRFAEVTVLFADIVGFTDLSSRISPNALVTFLEELFSTFDRLAEKHGLEKIKTIGDSYMAACGLPILRTDHAEATAEMALDMQEEIAKLDAAKDGWLSIRIGFHMGPVVAGVIGKKKFSYDLWGNTVNVASRMESNSAPGAILVSEECYQRLKGQYSFTERELVQVKGKGPMKAYFLTRRGSSMSDSGRS